MATTDPRTPVPLSPELRRSAEARRQREGIRSMAGLLEIALRAYLATPPGTAVATGDAGSGDPTLLAEVRDLLAQTRELLPAVTALVRRVDEMGEQLDDITVAIGRRRGAELALQDATAQGGS